MQIKLKTREKIPPHPSTIQIHHELWGYYYFLCKCALLGWAFLLNTVKEIFIKTDINENLEHFPFVWGGCILFTWIVSDGSSGFPDYLVKLYCFLSKWSLRNLKRVMLLFPHQDGNGYINDYPTGRFLRYAKLYEIGVGMSIIFEDVW